MPHSRELILLDVGKFLPHFRIILFVLCIFYLLLSSASEETLDAKP